MGGAATGDDGSEACSACTLAALLSRTGLVLAARCGASSALSSDPLEILRRRPRSFASACRLACASRRKISSRSLRDCGSRGSLLALRGRPSPRPWLSLEPGLAAVSPLLRRREGLAWWRVCCTSPLLRCLRGWWGGACGSLEVRRALPPPLPGAPPRRSCNSCSRVRLPSRRCGWADRESRGPRLSSPRGPPDRPYRSLK